MKVNICHLVLELSECEADLSDVDHVERAMRKAVEDTNLTELHCFFHRFNPMGVTGIVVLQESHISIHTWPEFGYAAVDLFTCGTKEQALRACNHLVASLRAQKVKRQDITRGI